MQIRPRAALGLCLLLVGPWLAGCTSLDPHRPFVRAGDSAGACTAASSVDCRAVSTETHPQGLYDLHIVEFDDQGWPFDDFTHGGSQTDHAIARIRALLQPGSCVRLFVYVHGWRHNASPNDTNLQGFREFLADAARQGRHLAGQGIDACSAPAPGLAGGLPGHLVAPDKPAAATPRAVQTVGLYVGWRGLSLPEVPLVVLTSFWDRKSTAERVAQGSVRELFGRLSTLAREGGAGARSGGSRLRVHVIGHSFGASIVFRAISQSLIDGMAEDLDLSPTGDRALVSSFFDAVVLANPAIEAARFDPLFRAAGKRRRQCEQQAGGSAPAQPCDQPGYQTPVLAIFTSEGDWATHYAFPVGTTLSGLFEAARLPGQNRAMYNTIGWDGAYLTHELAAGTRCAVADALPYVPPASADELPRYRAAGWQWCFGEGSAALTLRHLAASPVDPTVRPFNGALWNVRVSPQVMADHADIWNPCFQWLLLTLFRDAPLGVPGLRAHCPAGAAAR